MSGVYLFTANDKIFFPLSFKTNEGVLSNLSKQMKECYRIFQNKRRSVIESFKTNEGVLSNLSKQTKECYRIFQNKRRSVIESFKTNEGVLSNLLTH